MDEILRTNDIVLISFAEALLRDAGIEALVLDQNMSVIEGSLGILPRRVLVRPTGGRGAETLPRCRRRRRALRKEAGALSGRAVTPVEEGTASAPVTVDAFLGGRVEAVQPAAGHHRAGLEAVLLAASLDSRIAGTIVDLGAGVGVAGFFFLRCRALPAGEGRAGRAEP